MSLDPSLTCGQAGIVQTSSAGHARPAESRERGTRLAALIQSAPVAIIERATDNRVRTWNAEAERIFGWRRGDVLGGPTPVFLAPDADDDRVPAGRLPGRFRVGHSIALAARGVDRERLEWPQPIEPPSAKEYTLVRTANNHAWLQVILFSRRKFGAILSSFFIGQWLWFQTFRSEEDGQHLQ